LPQSSPSLASLFTGYWNNGSNPNLEKQAKDSDHFVPFEKRAPFRSSIVENDELEVKSWGRLLRKLMRAFTFTPSVSVMTNTISMTWRRGSTNPKNTGRCSSLPPWLSRFISVSNSPRSSGINSTTTTIAANHLKASPRISSGEGKEDSVLTLLPHEEGKIRRFES
jgi:hypothetical protein